MDTQLTKSLSDLIDETLQELDELRKSRFSAAEIEIEGPGDGIDGKPSNGKIDAKKSDDEDQDDQEEEEIEKDEDKDEDKDEEEEEEDEDEEQEPHKDDRKHEAKEKKIAQQLLDMHKGDMKKSLESSESLLKSYVEERVQPIEQKLETILDLVNKIADQPISPRGTTIKTTPLLKSADEGVEILSKAQVANKLFELKKSGTKVDSLDIAKAEMGQDLTTIVKKYEIS